LPPQVHVFVRDWLSSNNVLLKSRDGHVLIDSGHMRHAALTLALLRTPQGIAAEPLARLVNTHCHSDHMGGNAAIRSRYACPIAVPSGEAPIIEAWDQTTLLLEYTGQDAPRFSHDEVIRSGERRIWGDLEWRALAAPGHDMGALVFFNDEHRILISGDALWENGYGLVLPPEIDPRALPATRSTLEAIAKLEARIVIPGHGEPFADVAASLERAFARTAAFEADSLRVARHALKVLLVFTLLDRQRMALVELPGYVERVPVYRQFNETFFHLSPAQLTELLIGELERAGVVRRDGEWVVPSA
jgi:glyoxylase-like metal-dependent hydrolase (beta-lactamase superfamily II)